MAEIFDSSDSKSDGFELQDINAAEERYLQHIDALNNIDSDIEFSDVDFDENEGFNSDDDNVALLKKMQNGVMNLGRLEEKFSRNRYEELQRYLYAADTRHNPPRLQPGHDKLAHVRPILEINRDNSLQEYKPHMIVSIDEAMIGFNGRLGFKQYVLLKPTKRGIKVWVRTDPNNGYINDFQVYTGKTANNPELNLGKRVVLDLMTPVFGLGHHLYCDSFFTSPDLFINLWDHGTYAFGTVRANRKGLLAGLDHIKLKEQGQFVVKQKNYMLVTVWRDKKNINLLSTNCYGEPDKVNRKQKDGTIKEVACPLSVKYYNIYMNGVDHADQLRSTYNISRKCLKWWKYLFNFLVDMSIGNAYLLMRESVNHQIVTKKQQPTTNDSARVQNETSSPNARTISWEKEKSVDQRPVPQPTNHSIENTLKKRTCKMCTQNKIRKEPKTLCAQCKENLCTECFRPYHRKLFPHLFL
ncbi:unnamed protein product [Mytilus coruscus]|uniref:B box-type domain-containing protein n=1 Tax=Mytilus coruscus TaxID=42192 RepID=A0A6J8E6A0_MYTCO|nr:unnamed protein product [Mytilus coruscus]